ncbi:MAG: aldo/keto reductase [Candidatus Latescibacterota bacterium]|nr:aldo/keto reductase [Candidatus Latescibacterota bacterium]
MAELGWRRLGRTNLKVRSLGLGCAFFGNNQVTDQDAYDGVRRAIDLGLNYVDTSPLYGQSERRVGLALEGGYRENVYLQTKTGTHPDRRHDYSAEGTRWSIENSLNLLKTDRLDSVLIHDPADIDAPLRPGACLDELLKMKDEGLLDHIGIGVRDHEFHKRAIETGHIDIVLTFLDYTLLSQSVAETTLPLAKQNDVGVILASVQGMGVLAGPEPDDEQEERRYPGKKPMAYAMWKWCNVHDVSIRQLALHFCLAADIDGMVMAGPSNKQQVDEVIEAATTPVPEDVWEAFELEFGVRG